MASRRHLLDPLAALVVVLLTLCPSALALTPAAGTQAGHPVQAGLSEPRKEKTQSGGSCNVEIPVIGGLVGGACEAAGEAASAAGGLLGEAASAAGNGIMDALASWMIGAASTITSFVSSAMRQTSTPQLQSAWYEAQFQPMADLGAALGLLVALIAFASAAIRRSPEALAGTLAGIVRAGLGTSMAVALTVIGLDVCDQISAAVLSGSPHAFWGTVAHAWGTKGFGGFGSSALAMLIALIEVFAAIFVWLELIVRNAAIYIAVLFFPIVLAASIWPALSSWTGRLARLLLLFVILKPVALIVLALAGNAAAAGLSLGSGIPSSVGTILAATVIFALAAFAPWALMFLLAADAESAYMAAGMRTAAQAATTDSDGRSLRSGGGLRNLSSQNGASPAGGRPPGGGSSGGGGGSSGGGDMSGGAGGVGGGGAGPFDGGPMAGGGSAADAAGSGAGDGSLAVGGESTAAGSIAVAAGASAPAAAAGEQGHHGAGARENPQDHASPASTQQDGAGPEARDSAAGAPARPAAARDDGASPPQPPARAPAENASPGAGSSGEQEHSANPHEAARTSQPTGTEAPRPPVDTARTLPRSPRRGDPRHSPALTGAGSRPPNPRRPKGREQ